MLQSKSAGAEMAFYFEVVGGEGLSRECLLSRRHCHVSRSWLVVSRIEAATARDTFPRLASSDSRTHGEQS